MDIAFVVLAVLMLGWGMFVGRKNQTLEQGDRSSTRNSALIVTCLFGAFYGLIVGLAAAASLPICVGVGAGMSAAAYILSYLVGYYV
jgi:hypothetical protein